MSPTFQASALPLKLSPSSSSNLRNQRSPYLSYVLLMVKEVLFIVMHYSLLGSY